MMRRYGLLGEHLVHSYSPRIHAAFGEEPYLLFEVPPMQLEHFLRGDTFDAVNVTIPYKKAVMPYCDQLSERARRIGSVNTLVRRADGSLYGDNTDYDGFSALLAHANVQVAGKKAVILGSGGASQAVNAVLTDQGARSIVTISRSGENHYGNLSHHADAELVINATPVGMYPDNCHAPVSMDAFPRCCAVFDLIYNPARTLLLLDAASRGIPAYNGLYMLTAQALSAASVFRGHSIVGIDLAALTESLAMQMKNIALIGMPGCGKSAIGLALSSMTGRSFIDTDRVIEERAGKAVSAIFSEDGEEAFRALETQVLAEACARSGQIIATGGGVVTRTPNLPLLQQNSTVVFLDRPVSELPTVGRPLSLARSPAVLAEERVPLYRAWSEYTFLCNGVQETAKAIANELSLLPSSSIERKDI